jgi:hypothetical protein
MTTDYLGSQAMNEAFRHGTGVICTISLLC